MALLEMEIKSPYVYLGSYGELFSEIFPFSRALEVFTSTRTPALVKRISDDAKPDMAQSYGLGAFYFEYTHPEDMQIVSSGYMFEQPARRAAKEFFERDGECLCFGADALNSRSNATMRGWLLERPVNF